MNEARGSSQGIPKRNQVRAEGRSEDAIRGSAGPGAQEQLQSPSGFLEGYLNHVAENCDNLDEPQSLFRYAKASGQVISKAEITALRRYELTGGVEHEVFLPPGDGEAWHIIKVTRPPSERWKGHGYGLNPDAVSYLTRLAKMNLLAPGLDYRILGVTPTLAPDCAWPSFVTRMAYISGTEPTADELHAYMTKLGFRDCGLNVWEHASALTLGDVHTGNFIKTPDGRMAPIDVTVEGDVLLPEVMF